MTEKEKMMNLLTEAKIKHSIVNENEVVVPGVTGKLHIMFENNNVGGHWIEKNTD